MNRIYDYLVHKSLKGVERQTAELMARFVLRAFIASLLAWPLINSLEVMAESALMTTSIMLGLSLIACRFTKNTTLNGYIILASVYYGLASISVATGGLNTSFIYLIALAPLGAAMTLGGKHGRVHSFLATTVVLGIGVYTILTLPESPFDSYVNYILNIIVCASLILFSMSITRQFQKMKDSAFEEIEKRKTAMERIISNVQSGFLIIDKEYNIQSGYSVSCIELLDKDELVNCKLSEILQQDPRLLEHLQSCWEQVFEDFMPEEVTLGQSPSRFKLPSGRWLGLEGKAVRNSNKEVEGILFTIIDITELIRIEKQNVDNRQVIQVMKNREGFLDMVREAKRGLEELRDADTADKAWVMRTLHTMKGNTASFGLVDLAACIHEIESEERFSREDWDIIETQFNKYFQEHSEIFQMKSINEVRGYRYNLSQGCLDQLEGLLNSASDSELKQSIQTWLVQVYTVDIKQFLQVMEGQLSRISDDIGKPAKLNIEANNIRIGRHFSKFTQHLPNMFRNSLYHGIEDEAERGSKPWPPVITLKASEGPIGVRLEVIDDGRGINVEGLRNKLREQGAFSESDLAKMNDHQIIQGLFSDGVSTAESVNEIAGRGAGTSAVKSDIESMGGKIEVFSMAGQGTRFVIDLPQVLGENQQQDAAA